MPSVHKMGSQSQSTHWESSPQSPGAHRDTHRVGRGSSHQPQQQSHPWQISPALHSPSGSQRRRVTHGGPHIGSPGPRQNNPVPPQSVAARRGVKHVAPVHPPVFDAPLLPPVTEAVPAEPLAPVFDAPLPPPPTERAAPPVPPEPLEPVWELPSHPAPAAARTDIMAGQAIKARRFTTTPSPIPNSVATASRGTSAGPPRLAPRERGSCCTHVEMRHRSVGSTAPVVGKTRTARSPPRRRVGGQSRAHPSGVVVTLLAVQ